MSEFKVGDTVDPRTLPVGAVFKFSDGSMHWTVKARRKSGYLDLQSGDQAGVLTGEDSAILLSLPTPKRPPCDACGEESTHTLYFDSLGHTNTCDGCATVGTFFTFREKVLARRAQQTSTGSESATRNAAETAQAVPEKPEPVVPPRCSSCERPFWAGRLKVENIAWTREGEDFCGDCVAAGTYVEADHLTNDLDTRIAEVAPEVVRVEDMPGAWATPCAEDVS